jgi:hypothetical protein
MTITKQITIALILIELLIVFGFSSCYSTLRTGKYIVQGVSGYTVNFKGVAGDWHVPTDTLKIGDTIFLKRVFKENKANVW